MRERPVVVTDLREPLVAVHRRLIRRRTALMVVWILGWAATGFVSDTAWLALTILAVTGPVLWVAVWLWFREEAGVREAPARALPAGPAAGAGPPPASRTARPGPATPAGNPATPRGTARRPRS